MFKCRKRKEFYHLLLLSLQLCINIARMFECVCVNVSNIHENGKRFLNGVFTQKSGEFIYNFLLCVIHYFGHKCPETS